MISHFIRVSLLLLLICGSLKSSENRPLLRALEGMTSLVPTAGPRNFSNCVVVFPDGKFYLSLKRQEIGNRVTVVNFEGALNRRELQILHNLLDQDTLRNAPNFPNFGVSRMPSVDEWEAFEAQIDRGSSTQLVGYSKWKVKGSESAEPANKDSQASEVVLRPLVEWFRALKTYDSPLKRPASNSARFSCSFEDESKE